MKKHIGLLFAALLMWAPTAAAQESRPAEVDTLAASQAASEAVELFTRQQMQIYRDSLENVALQLQIANTAQFEARRALERQLEQKHIDDSIRLEELKQRIEQSKQGAIGYPVVVAGDTVRVIYTSIGVSSPENRADIAVEKIKAAARQFIPAFDSVVVAQNGMSYEIFFRDIILSTVSQSDALWEQRDQFEMARDIAQRIEKAMVRQKKMTGFLTVVKHIGFSLLIVGVGTALIILLNRLYKRRVTRLLIKRKGRWFRGWRVRDYELMSPGRQVKLTLALVKILRLALSLLIAFVMLTLLFSVFPVTRRLADTLFGWIWNPIKNMFNGIIAYIPDLIVIIIIVVVFRYLVKLVKYIADEIASGKLKIKGFYPEWATATFSIVRILLYAFAVIMIFPYLPGTDSKAFAGVSIFIGVLATLGSTSMISNMVAGIVINYMRSFKVGDRVKIGDTLGDVVEKTAFVTSIITHKQEVVSIPNSQVLASSVVNFSTVVHERKAVILHTTVTMGYDVPWREVHRCLIEAALRSEYILKKPEPFVLQTSLDDFYVSYELCAYTRQPEKQAAAYSQLHQNIQDVFNENGIELTSLHYRALRDGNASTIPAEYLGNAPGSKPGMGSK